MPCSNVRIAASRARFLSSDRITVQGASLLWVRVSAPAADSVLAQIAAVVADAQHRRPRVQAFADRVSNYFVPVIIRPATICGVSPRGRRLS